MIEIPVVGTVWDSNSGEDSVTILKTGFGSVKYRWNGEKDGDVFESSLTYATFLERFTLRQPEKPLEDVSEVMYRYESSPTSETRLFAIDSKEYEQVLVITQHNEEGKAKSAHLVKLDANEALDLAADLTRMAMQVKRREGV